MASVDPTEARKDARHAHAVGLIELGCVDKSLGLSIEEPKSFLTQGLGTEG
jgi:hypothetical protein